MTQKLKGRVAIVTGAGSGMGRAIAKLFAAEGARVVCADFNRPAADETASDIKQAGGESFATTTNVAKSADVQAMVSAAVQAYGTVDILVNNAGIMDDFEPVGELSEAQWERVLGVNLNGVMFGMRAAIPVMLAKGRGAIVNIASIGGLNGGRAGAAYTASKHAVVGLTKNTAFVYATKGIRTNAIAPGATKTNIQQSMRTPNALGMERSNLGMGLMPRAAEPEEIASLALFLASDDARNVNGAVIVADSGWTAY